MKRLLLLLCFIPFISLSQLVKQREYKKGNRFSYRLTTESFRNDQPDTKTISVSEHNIVRDSGQLCEKIKWISKTVFRKNDTLHLDSIAQKISPYKISLMPNGKLIIPPLTVPEMTGEITDLNTFYVAISPALHFQRLSPNLLSFQDSVLKGSFADGKEILKGEDCIQVTQKLLIRDAEMTVIQTSFLPPYYTGIVPFIDTIGKETFEVPNNFQMVRKGQNNKVNLLWGVEKFVITSYLNNRTGQLAKAEMINELNLRMRYNSSEDLKTYDAEIPLTIKRVLKLELIK